MNDLLWLAIRLPHLALDCHIRAHGGAVGPVGITETARNREIILDCNAAAREGGVQAGMPAPAACAVVPGLSCIPRDTGLEKQARQRIAAWCYQYSHQVCLPAGRNGVMLEIGASERLFGKAPVMAQRIALELGQIGYSVATGSAPTIEAAWLASHDAQHITCQSDIRRQLGSLSVGCLQLESAALGAMEHMGLRQLHELLRLPRKSLARRFGPELPLYLDRLLGIQPDPRRHYQPPERFSARLELPAEAMVAGALIFPLKRLLDELCGVLRGSDAALQQVNIRLGHENHPDTVIRLGLQSPSQEPERFMAVLRERLERLKLPAPVRDIRLRSPGFLKFTPGQQRLFQDATGDSLAGIAQLAERLQARLGDEAVHGITGVEDHRPEYSWRTRPLGEKSHCVPLPHRPAWLMARPRRCDIRDYEILSGPERIESGWWDGRDCRRDYFVAQDPKGCRLWIFHEYKPRPGWYLHGIFS